MAYYWWFVGLVLWVVPPVAIALFGRVPTSRRTGIAHPVGPLVLLLVYGLLAAGVVSPPRVACSLGLPPVCVEVSAGAGRAPVIKSSVPTPSLKGPTPESLTGGGSVWVDMVEASRRVRAVSRTQSSAGAAHPQPQSAPAEAPGDARP
jgi:hypothetical protein